LTDILPIKFAQLLVNHQFFIPYLKHLLTTLINSRRQSSLIEPIPSDNDDDDHPKIKKSPVFRINDIVPEMATNRNAPVVSYLTTTSSSETNQSSESRDLTRPWSDEEKQLLCKTIVRFPPGTNRRWEKIADVIGRHVSQVTDMAKQIQNTVGSTSGAFQNSQSSFSSTTAIDQNIITEREQLETMSDWSQADQHLLECALKTISKDTPGVDRWEQIARCIPGKTREECLARYRYIVQLVKAKKMT
jgi:DnaJ family protein C protein 1